MYIIEDDFVYKGLRCIVTFCKGGYRCGYVGVDVSNPLYGMEEYHYVPVKKNSNKYVFLKKAIDVHGGLSYVGGGNNSCHPVQSDLWWFGFDCAHANDAVDVESLKNYFPEVNESDCFLQGDIRCKFEDVVAVCEDLVYQIIDIAERLRTDEKIQ